MGDVARDESQEERADRNLAELLQELRVAGLGVQVLFGFLLSLPFTTRFGSAASWQKQLYEATLVMAAVATALLLGPVAYHRLVFRRHLKRHLVGAANVMAILGLATVGLTISAAVLLVVSYVAHGVPAAIIGVFVVCLFAAVFTSAVLAYLHGVLSASLYGLVGHQLRRTVFGQPSNNGRTAATDGMLPPRARRAFPDEESSLGNHDQ